MPFPKEVRDEILVSSARHCSVCHRYKGVKVEVHHIVQEADGGPNDFENGICLCFDCHCDAGHYNSHHPKGTKISPAELRKHKEAWEKLVTEGKTPVPDEIQNLLHFQYFACMNSSFAREMVEMNFENFPIKEIAMLGSSVLDYQRFIVRTFADVTTRELHAYKNEEEYFQKHPEAKKNNSEYPSFMFSREFKEEDASQLLSNESKMVKGFLKAGLTHRDFVTVNAHKKISYKFTDQDDSNGCGDSYETIESTEIYETLEFKSPFFLFGAITNTHSENIILRALEFEDIQTGKAIREELPPFLITPKKTVIVSLGQFVGHGLEDYNLVDVYDSLEPTFPRTATYLCKPSSETKYFGICVKPLSVEFESNNQTNKLQPHEFNSHRVFYFDMGWMGGSCPHAFIKLNNEQHQYLREILPFGQNRLTRDSLHIESDASEILIMELEEEKTFLNFISHNGKIVFKDVVLNRGDSIKINDLKKNDILIFSGYYQPNYEVNTTYESLRFRNNLIVSQLRKLRVQ